MAEVIELLFTSTPGPFGAAIRWRTASPWSHVDLVLPRNVPGAEEVDVIGATALSGMVRRPMSKALRFATRYGIATVDGVPDEAAVYDYMLDHLGDRYGWVDLTGFLLGRAVDSPANFCSEAVARALRNGGRHLFDEKPELTTPRDVWIVIPQREKQTYARPRPWGEWTEVES